MTDKKTTLTEQDKQEIAILVKGAIAEARCAECELTVEIVEEIVGAQVQSALGEHHREHHDAIAEFIQTWADIRKETRSYLLKAILTLITMAIVAGIIVLARNYPLH